MGTGSRFSEAVRSLPVQFVCWRGQTRWQPGAALLLHQNARYSQMLGGEADGASLKHSQNESQQDNRLRLPSLNFANLCLHKCIFYCLFSLSVK